MKETVKTPRRTKFFYYLILPGIWFFFLFAYPRLWILIVSINSCGEDPYSVADFISNFQTWIFFRTTQVTFENRMLMFDFFFLHSNFNFILLRKISTYLFRRSNESKSFELLIFKHNPRQFYVNLFHLNEEWLAVFFFYIYISFFFFVFVLLLFLFFFSFSLRLDLWFL